MKKIHIVYILALVLLAACKREDFLDRFPQDGISDPTYFKNENDLKLYLNRFYDALPVQRGNGENNSDNFVPGTRNPLLAGEYVIPSTDANWSYAGWANIRYTNYFLQRYQRAEIAEALKNNYAAEARFFRALFYWEKVKRFGAVPWISTDLTDTSSVMLYGARLPHKQVMDSVLADLNFAVTNAAPATNTQFAGRITQDVAQALKARIALWEGTFRKYHALGDEQPFLRAAVEASEALISSNRYVIWKTGNPKTDYYNLFIQEELKGNKESILARRHIKDVSMHNLTRQLSDAWPSYSKAFVKSFLDKNGTPIALSPLYKGDATLDDERADRDPRFTQLIATRGFNFFSNTNGTRDTMTLSRLPATVTGYAGVKNYSPDPVQWNANQSTLDLFIFRYAETLLINAEAKAELGEATQAVIDATINKIRDRVGMAPMVITALVKDPASDFPTLSVLIDEIRRERRIELAAEGFRFDDLLRWKAGKLSEKPESILGMKLTPAQRALYPAGQVNSIQVDANFNIRVYTNITSRVWNDKYYLYPVPTNELTLNPALLPQNTGWTN